MNFLKKKSGSKEERIPLCYDRRGQRLFAEDLVEMVEGQAEKRRAKRLPFELQWRLNANFLSGNQHCDINVHRSTVENYEPLYEYMSREVFNRIAPIMETRRSHLMRVDYAATVMPKSSEYEDTLKAQIADRLLRIRRKNADYRGAFDRVMGLAELTGSAFVLCWWDHARPFFGNTLLPEERQEGGTVSGDVAFTVLSPYEVLPEDLYAEEVGDQPSIIIEQVKTVSEIIDLYGVMLEGGRIGSCGLTSAAGAGGLGYECGTMALGQVFKEDAVLLRTYMEKPSPAYPEGRLIIVAEGKLLHYGALPYDSYPLCSVKSGSAAGQFFGKSVIENLIPLQRSYNGIKNRINDYINRSTCGQLLVEEGSVDADDLTDRGLVPGAPIVYSRGASLPALLETPSLSDLAFAQCEKLEKDMEYAAGVSGMLAGGSLPSSVSSAVAIEILQNLDTTRLSLYAENIRKGMLDLFGIWLSLYKRYVTVKRALCLTGQNKRGAVVEFLGEELCFDELSFEKENELQVTEDARRRKYLEAFGLGLFEDENGRIAPGTKIAVLRRLLGRDGESPFPEVEAQCDNARNENADFEAGKVPQMSLFDDHAVHLAEHRLYALKERFRNWEAQQPQKAEPFILHIKAHERALEEALKNEKGEL